MSAKTGWKARAIALFADVGGPWGNRGGGGQNGGGSGGNGPRNPWNLPPGGGGGRPRGPSVLDELARRMRQQMGGNGDGGSSWPMVRLAGAVIVGLWVLFTSFHAIGPQERGVVTVFGAYSRTLESGIGLTLPAPIERVTTLNVAEIRTIDIPAGNGVENFVLTGDQNIIDLDYSVRWSIADPELFRFQLADPEETIREVAESAMRAALSRVDLIGAIGAKRGQIEADVENRMRSILATYRSGVRIEGVAIKRADPPAAVMDAFKDVTAAQQEAQSMINQANTYSQQITQRARVLVGQRAHLRTNGCRERGQHHRVNAIGLGQATAGLGVVAHLAEIALGHQPGLPVATRMQHPVLQRGQLGVGQSPLGLRGQFARRPALNQPFHHHPLRSVRTIEHDLGRQNRQPFGRRQGRSESQQDRQQAEPAGAPSPAQVRVR